MQQQEKNNKGFNILELLVVLAIVGVISAVAYPNFSSWTKERKVRQASERIQSLMKNILIQTERGTFAYVQVLFENNDFNLVVTSKGMTMQTLATKINDANDDWNDPNKIESRCNTVDTDYWDTDLAATSDEIKNAVYSITLEDVTTNFFEKERFVLQEMESFLKEMMSLQQMVVLLMSLFIFAEEFQMGTLVLQYQILIMLQQKMTKIQ